MNSEIAFVGDIHGNVNALRGVVDALRARGVLKAVFLGDYINKGANSREVLSDLIASEASGFGTLLRGNHETALLDALDTGDLTAFIKMGGAMTIRSYVGGKVNANVSEHLKSIFPVEHLNALRRMAETYESEEVIAQHVPSTALTHKFRISAHSHVGILPQITAHSAQIDTGCGDAEFGRLTALFWPSLDYIQVSDQGTVVS